jgi:TatD DNase family protein
MNMEMSLVDTHCHLSFPPLAANIEAVLLKAQKRGVTKIVVPAYDTGSWPAVVELAKRPNIHAALGVHPWVADAPVSLDRLAQQLEQHRAVAVGEIGLDFKVDVPKERQIEIFTGQLSVARALNLPVLLHVRGAFEEMLTLLSQNPPCPAGVIHAFSRGPELAKRFYDLGLHIAFGGAVTHRRATRARRAAAAVSRGRPRNGID